MSGSRFDVRKVTIIMIGTRFLLAAGAISALAIAAPVRADISGQDRQFAITVGHANAAEIKTARLALARSSSPQVRSVADMLIKQHSQAQQNLMQLGRTAGVAVPNGPDPEQAAAYSKLSKLHGKSFDASFLRGEAKDHTTVIGVFNKELASGQDSALRGFAQRYLPDIQTHLQMVSSAANSLGIGVAGSLSGTAASAEMPAKRATKEAKGRRRRM